MMNSTWIYLHNQSAFLIIFTLLKMQESVSKKKKIHGPLFSFFPFKLGYHLSFIKPKSPNKVFLVWNRAEKRQWLWIFPLACLYPLEYSEFRKSARFLISQMRMTLVHFLCFSHKSTPHNVVYLNKVTGCLANRGIPWLNSQVQSVTILLKAVNKPAFHCQQATAEKGMHSAQHKPHSEQNFTWFLRKWLRLFPDPNHGLM